MKHSAPFTAAPQAMHPWQPHEVRIVSILQETTDTLTYQLEFTDDRAAADFRAQPGQFNMLYLPGTGEAAISLSGRTAPGEPLVHTVRIVGNVTRALARLRLGETFGVRGPFGSRWPIESCRGKSVIIVTGGIGLAPLRPVLYEMQDHRDRYGDVVLLYGARTPSERLYTREFDDWQAAGIAVHQTVDRADHSWNGNVGVVTLLLERLHIPDPQQTVVLTCGPEVMMHYVALGALQKQIPPENVWISLERNMNCAVGYCGHCQLGPAFICKDGPVLCYPDIVRYLGVKGL